jgi:uncharacterized protein with HEPN domain
MGELVKHLTKEFRQQSSDIPFNKIAGLRDITAHGYYSLNFNFIWNTLNEDVPLLKEKIEKILNFGKHQS